MDLLENTFLEHEQELASGLFAIKEALDSEKEEEFVEREKFIGLKIGEEEFYLSIDSVIEIIMLPKITYTPNSLKNIEGVFNLRGSIIPAVNIRKLIGLKRPNLTTATRVIITNVDDLKFGLIVDEITAVASFLPNEIENKSLPGASIGASLISRISKKDTDIHGILDLTKIMQLATDGTKLEDDQDDQ